MACPPAVAPVAVLANVHKIGDTSFGIQDGGMHTLHLLIEAMRCEDGDRGNNAVMMHVGSGYTLEWDLFYRRW